MIHPLIHSTVIDIANKSEEDVLRVMLFMLCSHSNILRVDDATFETSTHQIKIKSIENEGETH
jgi:hypothetical protein